ncbi:uncharacterized protein LOC102679004 [Apis dorsata]|uniref:uncharacterized protein LOC102679004 n=1 Tax=Apis dorsata TaxID=7462 RepID=UPI0003DF5789|nr:uncharacterized protein LOC102679004 [Apis dorsata]
MFAVFSLLLLLLGLSHCQDNDLPSRFEIESSINRTIEEVERQVREDSTLPRLTRQEIVKILQNITSQDLKVFKDKEKLERARNLYQRALMVVLPYSAEESAGNLKDLYTKPPMTRIISDFSTSMGKDENEEVEEDNSRRGENDASLATKNLILTSDSYKSVSKEQTGTTMQNHYKNHRDTYSEVRTKLPLRETLKLDPTPVRFTFNLENLRKNAYTTEKTTTAKYPIYRSKGNEGLEIVYSTSVTDEPTTKPASKEINIDLERSKMNQNVLTSSQWRYNAPPSTTMNPTLPSKLDKIPFLPTINTNISEKLTIPSTKRSEILTKDSNAEALTMNSETPIALYVTPMPTNTSPKMKYSSTYSLNSAGFRQATTSTTTMRPEVMDLLASIGLRPDNTSNVEDVYKKSKDMAENKFQAPDANTIQKLISASSGDEATSIIDQNTFENSGSEIKKGVENLTPDVQLLFKRFGLQTSNLGQPTATTTQRTTINFNSYTNFKPLPTSSVKDQEMRAFLAKFGLGTSDDRRQKSMRFTTEPPSVIEVVPENMRGILENIGLISRKGSKKVINSMEDMESTETSKFHVFKPHEVNVKDEEQRNKINQLLNTVKLVQEGKVDVQNVRNATKVLKDGPDPLKFEEIAGIHEDEDARNEVKRQEEQKGEEQKQEVEQEETTTVQFTIVEEESPTVVTEPEETTLITTTETNSMKGDSDQSDTIKMEDSSVTSNSNLMALEESFGGTTRKPVTDLPARKKSGLYFLVDWNSFLEVGEDNKDKINLRFQPKVGDRSRFLPVTVP